MRRTTLQGLLFPLFSLLLAASPRAAVAADPAIRFTTGNDFLSSDGGDDDLYTFSVALEMASERFDFSLVENAFTDREAGRRFDETQLNVGASIPLRGSDRATSPLTAWNLYAEVGAVRTGRGIFGEDVQNVVHRAVGADVIELAYEEPAYHGRVALSAERLWEVSGVRGGLDLGPHFETEWISALRSDATAGVAARWSPSSWARLEAFVGGRWSDADYAPLEPHVEPFGAAVRVGAVFFDRLFVSWARNDFGDGRTHLTVGYTFTNFRTGEAVSE